MTHTPQLEDPRVARAWAAFARHDASLAPSSVLDGRVLAAAQARPPSRLASSRRSAPSRRWRVLAAGVAAGLAATVVAARWVSPVAPLAPVAPPAGAVAVSTVPAVLPVPPSAMVAVAVPAPPRRLERRPAAPRSRPAPPAAAGVPVGLDDGPLQVIRVRVQASALDAFGVQLAGPVLDGLVDVDLVVGADGWPRDVRRIRPVSSIELPE